MAAVRVGLLVFYLTGTYLLNRYLRGHHPTSSSLRASPGSEPWMALFRVWGPTLWIFPGVLWIGLLDLSPLFVLSLSFLLPLCCLSLFLLFSGVFTSYGQSANRPALILTAGSILLFTALVLLAALIQPEISYAKFGLFCLSSITPTTVSVWLLIIWAPAVVPMNDDVDARLRVALSLVLGFFSSVPKTTWFVEDGKVRRRIDGNAGRGIGPGLLVTEPENVVVLKMGSRITRVAGPGAVLTQRGEIPFRVVDLRDQTRSATVSAITRDGIEVRVPISAAFRIQRGSRQISLGVPWPYRAQRDVLQALFAEEVDPSGRSPVDAHTAHPWEDLPIKLSAHKLEQAVSFYSLDQLYGGITDAKAARVPRDPQYELLKTHRLVETSLGLSKDRQLGDRLCRQTIGKTVRRSVQQALAPRGLEIAGGGVSGSIEPVSRAITEQRVEAWKSRFMAKVMDWQESIERKRVAALGKMRQDADSKMTSGLIAEMSTRLKDVDGAAKRELVAYHVLDRLIGMARSSEVQRMLPESALPALEKVFKNIERDAGGGENP